MSDPKYRFFDYDPHEAALEESYEKQDALDAADNYQEEPDDEEDF